MDYDALFRQQLDALRQEGNYRVFAELERHERRLPARPALRRRARRPRSPSGARTTISAWASTRRCSRRCTRRSTAAAPAPAAPATSPAPPTTTCCSSASSPTCTARRRRCSSPPATSRTGRRSRRSAPGCPAASSCRTRSNHARMIEGIRHARCEKRIWRHNDPRDLDRQLGDDRPGPAEDRRLRERLLDGRRHRADRRDPRRGRGARRDDLPRRGARGRPLRPARRRRRRGARADAPGDADRGHARQGVRRRRRLHRRLGGARRLHPQLRLRLHLHHRAAAGDRRRGAGQHRAPEGERRRAPAPARDGQEAPRAPRRASASRTCRTRATSCR